MSNELIDKAQPEAEPVANCFVRNGHAHLGEAGPGDQPLYTTPPSGIREGLLRAEICEAIRGKLRKASKGEPETWGFVAMFMDMVDEAEAESIRAEASAQVNAEGRKVGHSALRGRPLDENGGIEFSRFDPNPPAPSASNTQPASGRAWLMKAAGITDCLFMLEDEYGGVEFTASADAASSFYGGDQSKVVRHQYISRDAITRAADELPQTHVLVPGNVKPDNDRQVFFYEQDFYVLSNFSAFRVTYNEQTFDTSEAAYHYQRFTSADHRRAILYAYSAHEAFRYAQDHKADQRHDWDAVKFAVMKEILHAKAAQHEYVRRKLLSTGDRELIEDSWRDPVWGWGPNRDGKNMLGKLWMEIRAELRAAQDGRR